MATLNVHQAKAQLSRLLARAAAGEEIVIAKAGQPIARLVPIARARKRRVPGRDAGKVWIADDFDDLPPSILQFFAK